MVSALRDQISQRVQTLETLDQTREYLFGFGELLTKPEKIVLRALRDQSRSGFGLTQLFTIPEKIFPDVVAQFP